ncbi:MAG TPA: aldo/keto reductase [Tepidisphaeraceae bacterium]|jgi:aryl-alcohol dehydrogenase-like predicted oxidoreductase|nr:aldo/keto reductase [Tepidisphaeraceae bacterium]
MSESNRPIDINAALPGPNRRQFLQTTAAAGLTFANAGAGAAESPQVSNVGPDRVPRKALGKTGVEVSAMGLGGYSLADSPTLEEATQIVHEAVEAGINFFDNAWEYHDGRSEEWMGQALKGLRDKVFLMTKVCTHGRDKNVAMQQLEQSLKRLNTDHLDLWQIHECVYWNDPEWHFRKGGVVEALDQAKKQGKVRFVGFTGHKHPDIHLAMLSHDYPFDTVQMPLNCFDASYRSFEKNVLPEVIRRGMGALGMKSLCGGGSGIINSPISVQDALRYAMSLPVSTTISGVDSLTVLRQNLAVARGFKPLDASQMQALRDKCAQAAGDGHLELYKSTKKFDGKPGREQHGFPLAEALPV